MTIDKRVFPTSSRTGADVDLGTNLVTEYNIASITNKLSNTDSYVISSASSSTPDGTVFRSGNTLEFVIHGYYFKLTNFDPTDNTQTTDYVDIDGYPTSEDTSATITATIYINEDTNISYSYIVPKSVTTRNTNTPYELILLVGSKSENAWAWYIPDSSRIILNGYSITNLDEGTL